MKYSNLETFVLLKKGCEYKNSLEVKRDYGKQGADFLKNVVAVYYCEKDKLIEHITLKHQLDGEQIHILNKGEDKVAHRPITIEELIKKCGENHEQ